MWAQYDLPLFAWLMMTVGGDIDTRGGGVVGGNADVGRDYTGRDNQRVNIYNQLRDEVPNRPQHHLSDSDRIDTLEFHMYGQGDYWPGVIRQQKQIIDQQTELVRQNRNMMFMQITLFAVLTILVIVAIVNLIILRMPL